MDSPTKRSLKYLREQGYIAQVVERFNPYAKVRVDLFGFIDIVAVQHDPNKIVGVQTTTKGHMSDRIKKILGISEAKDWLNAGGQIHIHGWVKRGRSWEVDVVTVTLVDFSQV